MSRALFRMVRWAERKGGRIGWGNVVGAYQGQTVRETFRTEDEAHERERQVMEVDGNGDPLSLPPDRFPVALTCVVTEGDRRMVRTFGDGKLVRCVVDGKDVTVGKHKRG